MQPHVTERAVGILLVALFHMALQVPSSNDVSTLLTHHFDVRTDLEVLFSIFDTPETRSTIERALRLFSAALIDVRFVLANGHLALNWAVLTCTKAHESFSDVEQKFRSSPQRLHALFGLLFFNLTSKLFLGLRFRDVARSPSGPSNIEHFECLVSLCLKLIDDLLLLRTVQNHLLDI